MKHISNIGDRLDHLGRANADKDSSKYDHIIENKV